VIIDSSCIYVFSHNEILIKELPFITNSQTFWHIVFREICNLKDGSFVNKSITLKDNLKNCNHVKVKHDDLCI